MSEKVLRINFSHNWNGKLGNDFFTTIRRSTPEKKDYYVSNLEKVFDVVLNGDVVGKAFLRKVKCCKFLDLPDELLILDTGCFYYYPIFNNFGIDSMTEVLVLTFENKEVGEKK